MGSCRITLELDQVLVQGLIGTTVGCSSSLQSYMHVVTSASTNQQHGCSV